MSRRDGEVVDRYRRRHVLGEGGAGRVWLAEDRLRPGILLALKELAAPDASTPQHETSLRREFATLARLRHPGLPEVREFDVAPGTGTPRFTLELIEGRDLVETVRREGPALLPELAAEALRVLDFLHGFGFVHRDLKPANLLVRDVPKLGRRLVLVDLGLALGVAREDESLAARGTLPYMAPELFRNEPASARSDLYALGASIHEALFGRPPVVWDGGDLTRFVADVSEGARARLVVPEGVPDGLPSWIEDLLAIDPAERPASAGEALARLDESCGLRMPADTAVDRAARLLSGPPAERREEIARLESVFDASDGSRLLWLAGPAGSGKSRLLRWVESEAILRGWVVYRASGDAAPPFDELVRRAPALLLLDDVEEAGARCAEVIERIARDPTAPAARVVAAARPGAIRQPALARLLRDAGRLRGVERVDLPRLDAERLRAMARRATGGEVAEDRVRWLLEASEGSPARAEALLIEGAWERGERAAASSTAAVPEGRLAVLSEGARRWIAALAVTRGEDTEEGVAALAGLDPAEARAAAEEAETVGLAYRKGGRLVLESRSTVEAVLAAMQPAARRDAHRRAFDSLSDRGGTEADAWLLARLAAGAGDAPRAAALASRAGAEAEARGDPAEAAARHRLAVRLAGKERAPRLAHRMAQGRALAAAGLWVAAARAFGGAVRLAAGDGDRAEALARQADALAQSGKFTRALAISERAAALAESAGARPVRAFARRVAGIALSRLGREAEALSPLEEARALFRGTERPDLEADVVHALAACKLRLGRADAESDFRSAIALHRSARGRDETRPTAAELKAEMGLAVLRSREGRHGQAVEILERVRDGASALGNLHLEEVALSRLAAVAIDACRLDRGMALAAQAADLARRLGDPNLVLVDEARLADARIRCGRAGDAVALLKRTLDRPLDEVEPDNADYARMLLASAWLEAGGADAGTARGLLERSLEGCRARRKPRPLAMALVTEMERRAAPGCPDPIEPVDAELRALVERADEPLETEIRVRAALARAAHALARGDGETARKASREAAAEAQNAGFIAYRARALALTAEALERKGLDGAASEARREGRALLEEAASRIEDEKARADFLARAVYVTLSREAPAAAARDRGRLLALYDMIRALNSETDPDALVESILDLALRALRGERGMILLRDEAEGAGDGEPEFAVRYVRNLESETVRDAEGYSRGIVAAAGAGRSLLVLDAGEDERFRDLRSVSLYGIRSLLCVPLSSRGKIVGTVYLDGRMQGELFTQDDLRFLEAFADHAALALENALERRRLEKRNLELEALAETRTEFANLVGRSPAMQKVFDLIEKFAETDLPVLVRGESGTGKELVARALHFQGPRRRKTFLSENCAAIPETLLESALFGHVRGAFTGADRSRAGLFEQADGGTLFLDEVGDMSPGMQARLLRVLEDGEVRRVGGERTVRVDVRVVAATHRDLRAEVAAGRFREDLLYRLQVLAIDLPPLRERPGDLSLLVRRFLDRAATERGGPPIEVDRETLAALERHRWPGNVRELQNVVQRLAVLAGAGPITLSTLASDPGLCDLTRGEGSEPSGISLRAGESEQLRKALAASGGHRGKAAKLLGISRATLYRKMREHRVR